MSDERKWAFVLCGWGLFVVSAVFFIVAALRSGDMLGLVGSLFFFIACIVFIIPLVIRRPN